MTWVEINWKPDKRELSQFGLSMIIGFGLFAVVANRYWHLPKLAILFAVFGGFAGVAGLSGKRVALVAYLPWMALAFILGNIMSRLLVGMFFYLLITPMGLIMRVVGKDTLQRKNDRASYWSELPVVEQDQYQRQF